MDDNLQQNRSRKVSGEKKKLNEKKGSTGVLLEEKNQSK